MGGVKLAEFIQEGSLESCSARNHSQDRRAASGVGWPSKEREGVAGVGGRGQQSMDEEVVEERGVDVSGASGYCRHYMMFFKDMYNPKLMK
jgi:hypothetical protein